MQIRILGWAGGIGANLRTTSFLVDDDMLIDAGTGLGDLPLNQMTGIRHIFLTHSHMDHIVGLPLLADSMFGVHDEPIVVHAQEQTIEALKTHVFNWVLWPDFTELPSRDKPSLQFEVMKPGETINIRSREIEMIPVNHTVPGVAFCVSTPRATSGAPVRSGPVRGPRRPRSNPASMLPAPGRRMHACRCSAVRPC